MIKYFTEYRREANNIKILDILDVQFKSLEHAFETINEWKTVDNAEGIVLDEIGQQYGQLRKGMTDEVYRYTIKNKILSNNSKGDIYSVKQIISSVLKLEPGEFDISEAYLTDTKKAGILNVTQVPLGKLLESGMEISEFMELIKSTLAAGVGLGILELAGTFMFVDELETEHPLGFADEKMTVGGTLGAVFEGGID